jgi:hypothetical protein
MKRGFRFMIEITGDDISKLNDDDLRTLIALLCEADLRAAGLTTADVTWGGHQDAQDGGIDVRVDLDKDVPSNSFIPRSKTGIQVKKPDMPRKAIINEMRPDGELRTVIKDLVDSNGAYIIVSSQGSTADFALAARKKAMRDALEDYPNSSKMTVDFYDRVRIASWVRNHPSLVLWVREKIGRKLEGWRAYGNWSESPGGVNEEYLLDGHLRIYNSSDTRLEGNSVVEGINEIRNILHRPGSSVRLVGLSGVGKTRFVQTLFDERIGDNPLNKSQVFYADLSDSPNPNPRTFAEQIIAQGIPAILVVDNCNPELHKRLSSVCSSSGSPFSLITVEYDVRDDLPEETEVYRLEPSSEELIFNLIRSRFDHVSEVDSRTIANFSGGNARIALALANTIRRGENLGNLRDDELFKRLFYQRNEEDRDLQRVAEVCSLVYSFNIERTEGEGESDELKILGSLIGMEVQDIYHNVKLLQRRQLVQQRSKWRAVLPHAIANKLAKSALETIPLEKIYDVFENSGSDRLLKSFSRRLSYLHDSQEAIQISKRWLSETGILRSVDDLDRLDIDLLKNIAPINPLLTIKAIERVGEKENSDIFFSRKNSYFMEITRLLRSLAYDRDLFTQSVELLCRFALSENPNENYNSIRDILKSLFSLYLSGTHATPVQRLGVISNLIETDCEKKIELGFSLLSSALESWHFSSSHNFEFGAHSRNYGYSPQTRDEVKEWFKIFIDCTITLAISSSHAGRAKTLLANKFRSLWIKVSMYEELENAAENISTISSWSEGWLAVKTTKRFDSNEMDGESLARLNNLAILLEPNTLIDKARLFAIAKTGSSLDLIDLEEDQEDGDSIEGHFEVNVLTTSLAREVASNEEIFNQLLPELLTSEGTRLFSFGEGLAEGCSNLEKMWKSIYEQLAIVDKNDRNYQLLRGFLKGTSRVNRNLYDRFLDQSVTDKELAEIYPLLQTSADINDQDVERLKRSLELNSAPIRQYSHLAYGRAHETIDDASLCFLLKMISSKPQGDDVAIDILSMRLHGLKEESFSDSIISLGQQLASKYEFASKNNKRDLYELALIIKACFRGESGETSIRIICDKCVNALGNYTVRFRDYSEVINVIAEIQPIAFLDSFLGKEIFDYRIKRQFSDSNPLSLIDDDLIIDWCEDNPKLRYPRVASTIIPFKKGSSEENLMWTPLTLKLISNSYDSIVVLNELKRSLRPDSWSGSRADLMETRLNLIAYLKNHEDSSVAEWASKEERIFENEIQSEREWELERENKQNESFE